MTKINGLKEKLINIDCMELEWDYLCDQRRRMIGFIMDVEE